MISDGSLIYQFYIFINIQCSRVAVCRPIILCNKTNLSSSLISAVNVNAKFLKLSAEHQLIHKRCVMSDGVDQRWQEKVRARLSGRPERDREAERDRDRETEPCRDRDRAGRSQH